MIYYKNKQTNEVYAYESESDKEKYGGKDLVEMTSEEIQNHINPKPTIEHLESEARAKRDTLLSGTDWVVIRHRDEIEEGVKTTLNPEQYSAIQAYRRYLRDITEQSGFTENINWPAKPSF